MQEPMSPWMMFAMAHVEKNEHHTMCLWILTVIHVSGSAIVWTIVTRIVCSHVFFHTRNQVTYSYTCTLKWFCCNLIIVTAKSTTHCYVIVYNCAIIRPCSMNALYGRENSKQLSLGNSSCAIYILDCATCIQLVSHRQSLDDNNRKKAINVVVTGVPR